MTFLGLDGADMVLTRYNKGQSQFGDRYKTGLLNLPIATLLYEHVESLTYRNGAKGVRNTVGPFIFFQIIRFFSKLPEDNIYGTP